MMPATGERTVRPRIEKRVLMVEKPKSKTASEKYVQPTENVEQTKATINKSAGINNDAFSGLNLFPNPPAALLMWFSLHPVLNH